MLLSCCREKRRQRSSYGGREERTIDSQIVALLQPGGSEGVNRCAVRWPGADDEPGDEGQDRADVGIERGVGGESEDDWGEAR